MSFETDAADGKTCFLKGSAQRQHVRRASGKPMNQKHGIRAAEQGREGTIYLTFVFSPYFLTSMKPVMPPVLGITTSREEGLRYSLGIRVSRTR